MVYTAPVSFGKQQAAISASLVNVTTANTQATAKLSALSSRTSAVNKQLGSINAIVK